MGVFFGIRTIYMVPITWISFFIVCAIAGVTGCFINLFVLLDKRERGIFTNKMMSKLKK